MTATASDLWGAADVEVATPEFTPGNLTTKFLQPPFTVLDTRKGDWQARRRAWLALGIKSELGRGLQAGEGNARSDYGAYMPTTANPAAVVKQGDARAYSHDLMKGDAHEAAGISVFDPVLCELAYRWWAPEGGAILDPFAGGSVRGIVAAKLGHPYTGIDLSAPQVAANREQAALILGPDEPVPSWHQGDSAVQLGLIPAGPYDMVFSCPPYFDLEVYSDDPADLSAMDWHGFVAAYEAIIERACALLRPERFAVFVVSEIRGPGGTYRGLVPRTIHAFERVGMRFYNEAVLVNSAGSLPLRTTKQMEASRKLGRMHQNILCFVKGEPPRGWSYDRPAPPSPQMSMELVPDLPAPAEMDEYADDAAALRAEVLAEPDPPPSASEAPQDAAPAPDPAPAPTTPEPARLRALSAGTPDYTPVERRGAVWVKRDDTYEVAGVRGGKVRTCWALAQGATGLVTAGSRSSPQANIVAHVAAALGIPCRVHTPKGALSPELLDAVAVGAEVIQHEAGYNNVIVARARADALERGWREIPFGMECMEAVAATAGQVGNLPPNINRIVVPVGSGMSLAGILQGLAEAGRNLEVLGVVVGADPAKRLDSWAPDDWRQNVELVESGSDYATPASVTNLLGLELDAHYEAKAAPWLQPDDLLWCVGIRATQHVPTRCEDHPADHHPTQAEADECSAETYGEAGWAEHEPGAGATAPPVRGVGADLEAWLEGPEAGQVHNPETGEVREWDRSTWDPNDPDRRCYSCGSEPSHRNPDGSPAYRCPSHPALVVQEALLP